MSQYIINPVLWDRSKFKYKNELSVLCDFVKKYCNEKDYEDFKLSCDIDSQSDSNKADEIIVNLICKICDENTLPGSFRNYVQKFPQLYPDLSEDKIEELRSVRREIIFLDSFYDKIKNIINSNLE